MSTPGQPSGAVSRRAALAVLSLLVFGLVNVVRILLWGANPLWGFVILPPILLLTVFAWFAFRTERGQTRTG